MLATELHTQPNNEAFIAVVLGGGAGLGIASGALYVVGSISCHPRILLTQFPLMLSFLYQAVNFINYNLGLFLLCHFSLSPV